VYTLKCGDVVPGCAAEVHAHTVEDVLAQAAQHAADEHGLTDLDEETLAKVEAAITSE
jgi:predicted small metal-binding protein